MNFQPGSLVHAAYGGDAATGGYHCRYGLDPAHRTALERAGLRFTAFDASGNARAAELPVALHPFFVSALFQPERAALQDRTPPFVAAFVRALAQLPATRSRQEV